MDFKNLSEQVEIESYAKQFQSFNKFKLFQRRFIGVVDIRSNNFSLFTFLVIFYCQVLFHNSSAGQIEILKTFQSKLLARMFLTWVFKCMTEKGFGI